MLVTNRDSWVGTDWYDFCILTSPILAIQGLSSQLYLLKDAFGCPGCLHWLLKGYNKFKDCIWMFWYGLWHVTCHSWHRNYKQHPTHSTVWWKTTMWIVTNNVSSTPGFSLRATALCPWGDWWLHWRLRSGKLKIYGSQEVFSKQLLLQNSENCQDGCGSCFNPGGRWARSYLPFTNSLVSTIVFHKSCCEHPAHPWVVTLCRSSTEDVEVVMCPDPDGSPGYYCNPEVRMGGLVGS